MKNKLIWMGIILILSLPAIAVRAYIRTRSMPREYYSKVVMEFAPDKIVDRDPGLFGPAPFPAAAIKHKEIIYPVIDELGLEEKWAEGNQRLSKEQAYKRLVKMMSYHDVPGSPRAFEVGVYSTDPQEAANIANGITIQYAKSYKDAQIQMISLNLAESAEELTTQRRKVNSAHAEVVKIREHDHSIDSETANRLASAQEKVSDAQKNLHELKVQIVRLDKATPDNVKGLPLLNFTGSGKIPPQSQIDSLRKSLNSRLEIAQRILENRLANLKEIENTRVEIGTSNPEFIKAMSEYDREKKILDEAETRELETAREGLKDPLKILEKAVPASAPARPNVMAMTLIAAAYAFPFTIAGVVLLRKALRVNRPLG